MAQETLRARIRQMNIYTQNLDNKDVPCLNSQSLTIDHLNNIEATARKAVGPLYNIKKSRYSLFKLMTLKRAVGCEECDECRSWLEFTRSGHFSPSQILSLTAITLSRSLPIR